MAKLEYYKTSVEKANKFVYYRIDTKEQCDDIYTALKAEAEKLQKALIYRGVNNATFKLYSSAQRHWIQKEFSHWAAPPAIDFYHHFIQSEINNAKAWQNNLLDKFYRSFGHHTAYELAVLSFLQHYGAPTPLMDWTYSFDSALFFAIEKLSHSEGNDLDNYCSVYIINKRENERELINFTELYTYSKESLEEIKRAHPGVDSSSLDAQYANYAYSLIKGHPLAYISDFENNGAPSMYTNTNFNIINQEGLFIFNNEPEKPLENFFKGKDKVEEGDTFWLTKIICVDIHKNLAEHIKGKLESLTPKIDKEFIYPQEEKLASDSYINFLR